MNSLAESGRGFLNAIVINSPWSRISKPVTGNRMKRFPSGFQEKSRKWVMTISRCACSIILSPRIGEVDLFLDCENNAEAMSWRSRSRLM